MEAGLNVDVLLIRKRRTIQKMILKILNSAKNLVVILKMLYNHSVFHVRVVLMDSVQL